MKRNLILIIISLAMLIASTNVLALPVGWTRSENGSEIIITSNSGLGWLSPVASDGMSWNEVVNAQNIGGLRIPVIADGDSGGSRTSFRLMADSVPGDAGQ